ncbi:uncharacterized protein LOC142167070 [Nicotiana tabacum]|uniref:Uncharacterized protein LOC142167070 n=1 Tax=Nicotiana tabacum TaxID=4097 RepID=A0AC58SED7_TOBAC
MCDDMVLSWLLNSLSKEIAESVLYSQSAKDLWSDLEDRFSQVNRAKLFQLQMELSSVVQENSIVSTYFTKMKSLWGKLDALNTFSTCVCECECGAKVKSLKAHQDERLLQFLMGLNDIFIGVRSNILLSSPLPSIGKAYSLVIQDEKQREIHVTPAYSRESASFIATNQPGNFRKFNKNRMQKISFESKKNAGICSYFKKPEHSIDKCYRIHGFPANFKFTKQKRFQGGAKANNAFHSNEESEQGAENAIGVQNLTKENVAELLRLLQQVKMGQNNAGTYDVTVNVSCAGMTNFFEDFACLIQINDESWILDSGATKHMSFNKDFFTDLKTLPKPLMVKLPNSYRVKVTHSGTVSLLPNLILRNGPSIEPTGDCDKVTVSNQIPETSPFASRPHTEASQDPTKSSINLCSSPISSIHPSIPIPFISSSRFSPDFLISSSQSHIFAPVFSSLDSDPMMDIFIRKSTRPHKIPSYLKDYILKMTTIRYILATAVKKGWGLYQLDVNNDFLHGDLNEEVYMKFPSGISDSSISIVTIYVDDILLTGNDNAELHALKEFLNQEFKIKDLGDLYFFLGMEVIRETDGLILSRRKFTLDLLQEFDSLHLSHVSSPLDSSTRLSTHTWELVNDPILYRYLLGKLN